MSTRPVPHRYRVWYHVPGEDREASARLVDALSLCDAVAMARLELEEAAIIDRVEDLDIRKKAAHA